MIEYITQEEFEALLQKGAPVRSGAESEDRTNRTGRAVIPEKPLLEKRMAAKLLYEQLRSKRQEEDEPDWQRASVLADLYDCRTCVYPVAQIFLKGILGARREGGMPVFGMRDPVTKKEALEAVRRYYFPGERLSAFEAASDPDEGEAFGDAGISKDRSVIDGYAAGVAGASEGVSAKEPGEEALYVCDADLRGRYKGRAAYYVSSEEEYKMMHPTGATHLSFTEIMEGKAVPDAPKNTPILLLCDGGYRSVLAAQKLKEEGFTDIISGAFRPD